MPATPRRYDRFQDVEDPITLSHCWSSAKKRAISSSFGAFSPSPPWAEAYYLKMEERRLNPHHHVRKIVALSDIYDPQTVARAIEDALTYEAFSSEYIANLLEQRARFTPEASAYISPAEPISLR